MLQPQAVLALRDLPPVLRAPFLQQVHWFRKYKGFTLEAQIRALLQIVVATQLAPAEQVFPAAVVVEETVAPQLEVLEVFLMGLDLMAEMQT
jgi:hypothetical protein